MANLQQLLNSDTIKTRFEKVLDSSPESFISSILTIVRGNSKLQECDPNSILSAAGIAAALKLPINQSLGFAYIVPYKNQAQFQLGYKGLIQLALRTGMYETVNAGAVFEGQIKDVDFITGEIIRGEKISDEIVGYVAYFKLLNGFHKSLYMTVEEIAEHAKKYSQSYNYDLKSGRKSSVWSSNFHSMACKTVLKLLLGKFGIISIDRQGLDIIKALQADQAVINGDNLRYIDNEFDGDENIVPFDEVFDAENTTEEIQEAGQKND